MACTSKCFKADQSWIYLEITTTSVCICTWIHCIQNVPWNKNPLDLTTLKQTSFIKAHFHIIKQQCAIKASLSSVWLKCAHCHRRWRSYSTYACQPSSTKWDDKTARREGKEWWQQSCRLQQQCHPNYKLQEQQVTRAISRKELKQQS